MGVALWLTPKPNSQIYETLTSLATSLDPLFNDSIRFEPHITITSQLAVNSQADVRTVMESAIAALGSNFELDINFSSLNINARNSYFKKVFIGIEKNRNLISFSTIIRELYVELPKLKKEVEAKYSAQEWGKNIFDPHVSLVYTDLNHFDAALIKTITTRVEDYLDIPSIQVNQADELLDYRVNWKGGKLKIVNCEGPVNEWEILATADIH